MIYDEATAFTGGSAYTAGIGTLSLGEGFHRLVSDRVEELGGKLLTMLVRYAAFLLDREGRIARYHA